MNKLYILAVCVGAFFLAGCPFQSLHQLGNPVVNTFDNTLLGTWGGCDVKDKTDCSHLRIYRFNATEYYIEMRENAHPNDIIRLRGFMTDIGVPGLMDAQELDISTGTQRMHYFAKLEMQSSGKLKISFMSDEFTKKDFKTDKEFIKYVKNNYRSPGFFDEGDVFEREAE